LVGADIDAADAVLGRSHRDAQRPGTRTVLAEAESHAAAERPAQAEADVLKIPFVAALLLIDDQTAVLQTDLVEILPVEPGEAQAVQPVETRQDTAIAAALRSHGWHRRNHGRGRN